MLKPQFLNLATSSFLMWLDDYVLSKGSGIFGVSSYFYPIGQQLGKYIYAAPYQPFIANEHISGNISPTGIYLSGSFIQRGQSGFRDYNYKRGWAIFDNYVGDHTKVSGSYSVSEINILPLNVEESKLLFDTKFSPRPKTSQTLSGLNSDSYTYPAIYVKGFSNFNTPYAFGGQDLTEVNIGLMCFMDSAYSADCLKSILADSENELIPLLTQDKFPFNIYGGFKETGSNFNYDSLKTGYLYPGNSGMYVKDVVINSFRREYNLDFSKTNPDVHTFICDITICKNRFPRSNINNL